MPPGAISTWSGTHGVSLFRMFHRDRAVAIEPLGEDAGELGGHVLNDDDRRQRRRAARERPG